MSDYFQTMESEFSKIIQQISKKLTSFSTQTDDSSFSAIRRELNDAASCIAQMNVEVEFLARSQRKEILTQRVCSFANLLLLDCNQVNKCRQNFDETKKKISDVEEAISLEKQKQALLGSQEEKDLSISIHQSDSLLVSQNKKLQDAKKTAAETLEVALNINVNLKGQTETMSRNIGRLDQVADELGWSSRIIDEMNKRIMQNKVMMVSVFGIIGLACVGILASYF